MGHDLTGKVAVVVGGGQKPGDGIGNGRATCISLARQGAIVVPVARHLDRAQRTVDEIESEGGTGWAYEMDVVHRDQCAKLFKDVKEKFGHIDIMVYNVGTNLVFDYETNTTTPEAIHTLFDIDLTGSVWCTLECAPYMAENENGGAIVNVSSIASVQNQTGITLGFTFYSLAKAGMNKWTDLSSQYYAPMGIRINTLVLGPVKSIMGISDLQMLQGGVSAEQANITGDLAVPLKGGRKTVWETANAISFLVSDDAKFVTGIDFILDGGTSHPRGPSSELLAIKLKELGYIKPS
jgi:NAD(P)-dependent dehydrogenase (short-subunit alcohol dehydrogenase family)